MHTNLDLHDWAGQTVEIVIDRALGSQHPRHPNLVYEVNYGYIPGTTAADGHPIDVYVLGVDQPVGQCRAQAIGVVHRQDDVEDKLVVALSGQWDEAAVTKAVAFQERWFDSWVELTHDAASRDNLNPSS